MRVAVALLLLCACTHSPWVDPGWGWETVRTEHFIVHSDRSGRTIEQALVRFEETYAALAATIFHETRVPPIHSRAGGIAFPI
jgi:hypothetical protein